MFIKSFIKAQTAAQSTLAETRDRIAREEGEVASWIILAALIAVAAAAAGGEIAGLISDKAGIISDF